MRFSGTYLRRLPAAIGLFALLITVSARVDAANGTWTESTGDGQWSNPANWSGGTVADGAGSTADFSTVDLNAVQVHANYPDADPQFYRNGVGLDTSRTIGNMIFADANSATLGGWEVYTATGAELLTLAGGTPTITVNPLGPIDTGTLGDATPELIDDAILRPNIAGTEGFTKAGAGTLTLAGSANTITGNINVNAGMLRLTSALPPGATINIGDGATLATAANLDATGSRIFNVAPGTTANLRIEASSELGRFVADNATLNVNIVAAGATFTPSGNWGATGSPTAINVSSTSGGTFRIAPNLNSSNGGIRNFNGNTFVNTAVSLDNVTTFTRTNSGGNTVSFGSLSGTSTAVLTGGGQGGGTAVTYVVGSLNTNTEFAGNIDWTVAPDPDGSLNLTKTGTGTLTLSGQLNYQPSLTGKAGTNASLRGGITRVENGTLALTNGAAIAGGLTDATAGDMLTTINLVSPGALDVSGHTGGTYSTAALQQVIGDGTILGNYNHGNGFLRPGNTLSGNNPLSNATAGTLTFADTLSFSGSGTVVFDLSPSTASGNDLLQVGGANLNGTPTLQFNFLGGVPSGTYTLINSDTPLAGSTSGWNVAWAGRGAAPTLTQTANQLQITVSPGAFGSVTWRGNVDSTWDITTTPNWVNANTNASDNYFQGDTVTFADTTPLGPVVSGNVSLAEAVTPSAVVVNNNSVAYSITGGGKISGSTGFTKQGSGSLVLQTGNDFTGTADIQAGTVDIGDATGALGVGNLKLGGAKLIVANASTAGLSNSGLTVSGNATIQADGATNPLGLPAMSGNGTLTLTTTVQDKLFDIGANGSFTGNLNIGADGVTATAMGVRFNGASSGVPNSVVTLSNGGSIRDRATSVQTIEIGALVGDATTVVQGYQGGSGATEKTWRIGALNTSTTFAGTIIDGAGDEETTAPTNITKVGTGTLTLTGVNTYTGDTSVEAGTLSIANAYLADAADVLIANGATLNLNFAGTDTISSLFFGGISQAIGTWGAVGSGATFTSPLITGTGLLEVTMHVATPVPGDFDGSGTVDSADLAKWRADVITGTGSDANGDGRTDGADFMIWQRNLGLSSSATANASAVPEPATALLVGCVLLAGCAAQRRQSTGEAMN